MTNFCVLTLYFFCLAVRKGAKTEINTQAGFRQRQRHATEKKNNLTRTVRTRKCAVPLSPGLYEIHTVPILRSLHIQCLTPIVQKKVEKVSKQIQKEVLIWRGGEGGNCNPHLNTPQVRPSYHLRQSPSFHSVSHSTSPRTASYNEVGSRLAGPSCQVASDERSYCSQTADCPHSKFC